MDYINQIILEIKNAKTDNEISNILCDIYVSTQMDSSIREEFDDLCLAFLS